MMAKEASPMAKEASPMTCQTCSLLTQDHFDQSTETRDTLEGPHNTPINQENLVTVDVHETIQILTDIHDQSPKNTVHCQETITPLDT